MQEWLTNSLTVESPVSADQMLLRLLVATVYGVCVAMIYRVSHGRHKDDPMTLKATLVMLSILIGMVSMVIGDSVARAFALVGALSIVRFRTVVEDTRDTAFVIFAVIVGMAAGTGHLLLPLIGIPVMGVAAVTLSYLSNKPSAALSSESTLSIRLALGRDPEQLFDAILKRHLESYRLIEAETARQGSALDLKYLVHFRTPQTMPALVAELNQVEGVQSVDAKS